MSSLQDSKLRFLNMVALPHYPMLCRPFRTHLPEHQPERWRGQQPKGRMFYTFSLAWHSVFNCWWWSEPNHKSESVLCPLYHRYRERIRSEFEAEEKRNWDLSCISSRGLWLEKAWLKFFTLRSSLNLVTSHEVKSACQPKGWCTSFGLTSAKLRRYSFTAKYFSRIRTLITFNILQMVRN